MNLSGCKEQDKTEERENLQTNAIVLNEDAAAEEHETERTEIPLEPTEAGQGETSQGEISQGETGQGETSQEGSVRQRPVSQRPAKKTNRKPNLLSRKQIRQSFSHLPFTASGR